jgi:hypothetical protein
VVSSSPTNDADADVGETISDTASCTAPQVAYGGGGTIAETSSDATVVAWESYPSDGTNNRDWTYSANIQVDPETGGSDQSDDVTVTAYVLCGNP